MVELADLTCEHFAACVAQPFTLRHPGRSIELRLESATPRVFASGGPAARRSFSLLFSGPREPLLPQATYRLENPNLGSCDIFIVPIRADAQRVDYEAVFG